MDKKRIVNAEKAVVVEHLSKYFEVVKADGGFLKSVSSLFFPSSKEVIKALKDISFTIEEGELVGFIGPNGAGKTTTLKILSGLLYPTSGFVQVLGYNPWDRKPEFLKKIALVMGQKNQLWWDLPAIETFKLNKAIYEIPEEQFKESLNELVELLDVGELLNIQVRKLSLGQRMKLELVAALLHKPKVLFLDEPTIGLDVIAQKKLRDFIFNYNKRFKSTILLTSHNMDDFVNLAKRVIVIDRGEIFFDGEFKGLIDRFARKKLIKVYLSKEADINRFEEIGKIKKVDYPLVVLAVPRETATIASAKILRSFPIADLTVEEEPIDSIIRRVFRSGSNRLNAIRDSDVS
jgi:ABC-2 type transport system ATP-binding protein